MAKDRHDTGSFSARGGLPGDARETVAAQHEQFGGINWGAAFFGWLSANGLAVILLAIASAAGVATGLTKTSTTDLQKTAQSAAGGQITKAGTIGIAGAVAVLVILALAYYAGGYVAGRMSRFDGARQGVAVWLIGLIIVILLAVAGAVFGAKYNVLSKLDLPRIPVDEGTATTGGIIALLAVLVITFIAAALGGKTGERYHRKIDRAPFSA